MRTASSIFIVTLLCCGSLAGVARHNASEDQKSAVNETKSENAGSKTKSQILLLETEENGEDDTRLELPERETRAESDYSSPLNQVTEYVRSMLPRGEVIRPVTRQIMGVVQGREGCWQKTLCQAGSMLAGFRQTPEVFNMIDKYSPDMMREHFTIMKSAAVDGADCTTLICYV